jgi:2-octaprenyl-6-methoxyphenol hydroxylase
VANLDTDILIIGGGLVGTSLMLALVKSDYRVTLVEAMPLSAPIQADFDARSLALSPATVRILRMLGVWQRLEPFACPIKRIHVSERFGFGSTLLDEPSPLGHVVEMQFINQALQQCANLDHVIAQAHLVAFDQTTMMATIQQGSDILQVKTKLIVAADGADSSVRKLGGINATIKDYHQQAIVANIGLLRPHEHIAYERFTTSGPMAFLPMNGLRASLVWALPPEDAKRIMLQTDAGFLSELQQAFGYRLGRFTRVGKRMSYPLKQVITRQHLTDSPVVFIGNAAQTLHPVAGQGFNLGLRDVAMLAQCIVQKGISTTMLTEYQQLRSSDRNNMIRLTDGLVELFTSKLPGVKWLRRAGLLALDQLPVCKDLLAQYTRGFAGIPPDLVCGISLGDDYE